MLTAQLYSLLDQGWRSVFAQKRSRERAIGHALALPCIMGRRTISRTLCALGRSGQDWSADYKMFSRSRWQAESLFDPVIDDYLVRYPEHARTNYRDPAYLLSTDLVASAAHLIQAYFDRWQIEVNHRDEKDLLGVGQAQVRSPQSVPRHPAFAVASYSLSLLAALRTFGPGRTSDYLDLPKWRKHSKRPSFLDILTILRKEYNETSVWPFLNINFAQNLTLQANT
ncbi:MAG: hypothetical protein HW384_936 [Dehalococcoidia bacterium]|nr:hypothetical protein [Dehalococcoidia bacterium]